MKRRISKVLVTGGAGFIGSALVRFLSAQSRLRIVNLDKLTYAGNLQSLPGLQDHPNYLFKWVDLCDADAVKRVIDEQAPDAIVNLAAESHVDRSIGSPGDFVQTNVVGTYNLLNAALDCWRSMDSTKQENFVFLHVSTDEVYGSLGESGAFTESSPYRPNSPYSASKAASDHLARAWYETYDLPVIVTNSSNNYGAYQFPEKLIPLMIINALRGQKLPVYGTGANVRDWLFVEDHVNALWRVIQRGRAGQTYNIGGSEEHRNIEVVRAICAIMDEMRPEAPWAPHESLISFIEDRPGHDFRYAIDHRKITDELGWRPAEDFATGLHKTVAWYLRNSNWWQVVMNGSYRD